MAQKQAHNGYGQRCCEDSQQPYCRIGGVIESEREEDAHHVKAGIKTVESLANFIFGKAHQAGGQSAGKGAEQTGGA